MLSTQFQIIYMHSVLNILQTNDSSDSLEGSDRNESSILCCSNMNGGKMRRSIHKSLSDENHMIETQSAHCVPKITMTVEDMSAELNISRPCAYTLVKQADFPSFRIGHRILVNREGLQQWINERCKGVLSEY